MDSLSMASNNQGTTISCQVEPKEDETIHQLHDQWKSKAQSPLNLMRGTKRREVFIFAAKNMFS
jgi:hypothetical protein